MTQLDFRPVNEADEPFLFQVYASSREAEMALVPWDGAQREAFLRMQFQAQHHHCRTHFPHADHCVVRRGDSQVGRLYVDRGPESIRILDLTILPDHRNQGIGSAVIGGLIAEGVTSSRPVRIYVESFCPSLHLFDRLGFRKTGEQGVHYLLEWKQPQT